MHYSRPTMTVSLLNSLDITRNAANSKGRSRGVVLTVMTTSMPESMNRMAKGMFS